MKLFLLVALSFSAWAEAPKKTAPTLKDLAAPVTEKKVETPAVKAPAPAPAGKTVVVMETSMGGPIKIELDGEKAPVTVKNFLAYVDAKFYDGTIFHRVINGFMIQGGGFLPGLKEKKGNAPIVLESKNGLLNEEGTIAMARTGDPNSASSQFFINVNNNTSLNHPSPDGHGYAVFGRVTEGMYIINRIKLVKTGRIGYHSDVPMDEIVIKSIRRL